MEKKKAIEIFNRQINCYKTDREECVSIASCSHCEHNVTPEELTEAMQMAISALEKQEQDRWHSIAKEGNPKEKGLYIITKKLRDRNGAEMHKVAVDRWSRDGLGKEWTYNSNAFVSAWKPLPEPYTEEES